MGAKKNRKRRKRKIWKTKSKREEIKTSLEDEDTKSSTMNDSLDPLPK